MKYLHLVILLHVYHHIHLVIAQPFEVSSHSPKLGDDILPGVKKQQNLKTQTPKGLTLLKTVKEDNLKTSKVSRGSRDTLNQQGYDHSPIYQSTNQVASKIIQDDINTIDMRYPEREKDVSESFSNTQEIAFFGKRIKVNPIHTMKINHRLIETSKTNTLRISEVSEGNRNSQEKEGYNQSLVNQYTNQKRKEIHPDEPNTSHLSSEERSKEGSKIHSIVQEMTLFGKKIKANSFHKINIRNFATHKMNRLCMLYSRHLVEELTSSIISRFKKEKGLQYQSDLFEQYNTSLFAPFVYFVLLRDPRKAVWDCLLSTTTSIMVEFHKQESRLEEVCDTQKLYKFMLWHTEMMYHLTNPKLLDHFKKYQDILTQSSITEINKGRCPLSAILSMIASKLSFERLFGRSQGMSKVSASYLEAYWRKDYEYNYPVSGNSNSLQSSIKQDWDRMSQLILESCTLENSFDFFLVKEELNQETIRQDLSDMKDLNFFHGLKFWMKQHEKQKMKFSDPFCVTALFNFLQSRSPGIDLGLFWKAFQENERKRKSDCARTSDYYYSFRKFKLSKSKKSKLDGSQSQES
ncbi:uncharacterized protein MELLADRAFT_70056 [Melampsora larici-populina 98AG31]|uniref:Secreted protein n=1 Tax=Melampsora larici-populina (strain 98AG31 / pathotype 3-4-7) TaxID=747676 RepID=F4SDD3_MELLP|nr:uncharacterized protein MELLADRAFT_70056 [Melampsora larici-populina 98AG31]EGF97341.1 hypothetical protein MELLADRAFT_70056 [Melampsora larici-populina 98AG31]